MRPISSTGRATGETPEPIRVIVAFSLWIPVEHGIRAADLEKKLADLLSGRPLRWAITACREGRFLVEGAVLR